MFFTPRNIIEGIIFVSSFIGIGVLVSEFLDKNYWYTAGMFGYLIAYGLSKLVNIKSI